MVGTTGYDTWPVRVAPQHNTQDRMLLLPLLLLLLMHPLAAAGWSCWHC